MARIVPNVVLAIGIGVLSSAGAAAGEMENVAMIGSRVMTNASGSLAVNIAAGELNQQFNGAAIANGEAGLATIVLLQDLKEKGPVGISDNRALVYGDAFAGAQGLVLVNMAAGHGNLQANAAVIAIGLEGLVVADSMLSQTRSSAAREKGDESGGTSQEGRVVGISPGAFSDASGILQVNLTAGVRNTSANTFALTMPGGARP